MKATIWILSTTIPGDVDPVYPQAFGTFEAARAAFLEAMDMEWGANAPCDDAGDPLPFPVDSEGKPDADEAHRLMAENDPGDWGRWNIYGAPVDLPEPPDSCDMGPPPPCPEGLTLYRAEVVQDCNAYTRAWVAGKSPEDALAQLRHSRRYGGESVALTGWTEYQHGDPFDSAQLTIYAADDEDMGDELASEED